MVKIENIESIKSCEEGVEKALMRLYTEMEKRYPELSNHMIINIIMMGLCNVLIEKEFSRDDIIVSWHNIIIAKSIKSVMAEINDCDEGENE